MMKRMLLLLLVSTVCSAFTPVADEQQSKTLVKVEAFRHQKFHDAMTIPAAIKIQQLKQKRQEDVAHEFSELLENARMHSSAVDRLKKKMMSG